MTQQPPDFEARLSAVEARLDVVAADAAAARHLAAANDRDFADLGVRVEANRSAINALGQQTAARFERLERKVDDGFARVDQRFSRVDEQFARVDENFARVDEQFATVAVGMQHIVDLLNTVIDQRNDG